MAGDTRVHGRAGVPARPLRATAPSASADTSTYRNLSLAGLRAYRASLVAEESRVSYWRRLISVRLDVVRAGAPETVDGPALVALLHEQRGAGGRAAMITILPDDDVPPLPDLGRLWATDPTGDPTRDADLARLLASAEAQLSAYRRSLHRRLSAATAELVRRYTEDPTLCLSALPGVPAQRRAADDAAPRAAGVPAAAPGAAPDGGTAAARVAERRAALRARVAGGRGDGTGREDATRATGRLFRPAAPAAGHPARR